MFVKRITTLLSACLFCLTVSPARAENTHAQLLLGADTARPGDTVMAGVHFQIDPGWHIYWQNPGDSGFATEIEWQLPAGMSAGSILWPAPEKLRDQDLLTYIYKDDVVLLI